MLRSKFVVESIEYAVDKDNEPYQVNVTARAVYSDSEENKLFWNATPAGYLQLCISNKNAFNYLVRGKEYYLDLTEVNNE